MLNNAGPDRPRPEKSRRTGEAARQVHARPVSRCRACPPQKGAETKARYTRGRRFHSSARTCRANRAGRAGDSPGGAASPGAASGMRWPRDKRSIYEAAGAGGPTGRRLGGVALNGAPCLGKISISPSIGERSSALITKCNPVRCFPPKSDSRPSAAGPDLSGPGRLFPRGKNARQRYSRAGTRTYGLGDSGGLSGPHRYTGSLKAAGK